MRGPRCVGLRRVLIHQMCVLGPATATEVFHLHHLRQHSLVEMILQSWHGEIALVNLVFVVLERIMMNIIVHRNMTCIIVIHIM